MRIVENGTELGSRSETLTVVIRLPPKNESVSNDTGVDRVIVTAERSDESGTEVEVAVVVDRGRGMVILRT